MIQVRLFYSFRKQPASSELTNVSACEPAFQALQLALYRGRASVVRTLLAQCEDVNAIGGHFGTLMQAAAFGGRGLMVRWLIDLGADVHARGRYGSTLRAASFGGHNAVVHLLLNHGARVDEKEDNALQAAALNGHLETVKLLVTRPEGSSNWAACHDSALETASFKGHLKIVQLLLRNSPKKSGLDARVEYGKNAFLAAVIAGQESVVEILIEEMPQLRRIRRRETAKAVAARGTRTFKLPPRGPKIDTCDDAESTFERIGCLSSSLIDVSRVDRTKHSVARDSSTEHADLQQRTTTFAHEAKSATPLGPSDDLVKDCFDLGSLTEHADLQESTAPSALEAKYPNPWRQDYLFRITAEQGNRRMVERLIACGYKLNETNVMKNFRSHQPTALEIAVLRSDFEIVKLLLGEGASLDNALHFAVRHGDIDVVRKLLACRPETELDCFIDCIELQKQHNFVSRRNMSNRSLLAIAVERRHEKIILALLTHKGESSHRALGLSMIVAARNGYEEIIRAFLEYGCDADGARDAGLISDTLLRQSFREASANGHLNIVKMLLEQCNLNDELYHCISIAACEARTHGQDDLMVDLRALTHTLDESRFLGEELVAMASTRPAYDPRTKILGSSIPYLDSIFDRLKSRKVDSEFYLYFQLKALKAALKAGQYENARFLLEKDTSYCILVEQSEILHLAICNMWINDFHKGRSNDDQDTGVHGDIIRTLIKHGAPTGSYDSLGNTTLFYACSNPIPGIFQILIESKASPWTEYGWRWGNNLESPVSSPENVKTKKVNILNVALQSRLEHEDGSVYKSHQEWEMIILSLLDLGMQIDPNDASLINFLHVACSKGNLECVQKLANGKASIHAAGRSQENYFRLGSAIHAVVIGAQVKVLQYLLDAGVNVLQKAVYLDFVDSNRLADETAIQTAFHTASHAMKEYGNLLDRRGHYWNPQDRWDILKILLEVWDGTDDCTTVFRAAITDGKVEIIELLLRRSKRAPEIGDFTDIQFRRREIVKLLVDHGTTIHLPPKQLTKFQKSAVESTDVSLLELLVTHSGLYLTNPLSHVPILLSSTDNEQVLNTLRFLLERCGCDVNATFQSSGFLKVTYDTNILLEACRNTGEKTVEFLLEKGADPDGPGLADTVIATLFCKPSSRFPSSRLPEQSTIRQLLDHGAEINGSKRSIQEAEKHPRTLQPPLIRAIDEKSLSMVEFLVVNGADVNATSGPETPLHLARRKGYEEIADFLTQRGAIDRYDNSEMGRRVWERPGLTPVTTESLIGHDKLRFP